MAAAPRFVFGRGLVDLVAGEPAVLADHAWIWTDRDDAVAVPVPGRQVHGVLVEAAGEGGETRDVTVRGRPVRARVDVAGPDDVAPEAPTAATLAALLAAADRLGLPAVWREHLELWGRAARPPLHHTRTVTLRELLTWPGVREEVELRSRFGFMAIHGGDLEAMTDTVARTAAERSGASYYGVVHPDGCTTHVASTAFDPAESPALRRFVDHVDVVVSVHGYGRRGRWRAAAARRLEPRPRRRGRRRARRRDCPTTSASPTSTRSRPSCAGAAGATRSTSRATAACSSNCRHGSVASRRSARRRAPTACRRRPPR